MGCGTMERGVAAEAVAGVARPFAASELLTMAEHAEGFRPEDRPRLRATADRLAELYRKVADLETERDEWRRSTEAARAEAEDFRERAEELRAVAEGRQGEVDRLGAEYRRVSEEKIAACAKRDEAVVAVGLLKRQKEAAQARIRDLEGRRQAEGANGKPAADPSEETIGAIVAHCFEVRGDGGCEADRPGSPVAVIGPLGPHTTVKLEVTRGE